MTSNTFTIEVTTAATYYLKAKTFASLGNSFISHDRVFKGNASYNKEHRSNFINIEKLYTPN